MQPFQVHHAAMMIVVAPPDYQIASTVSWGESTWCMQKKCLKHSKNCSNENKSIQQLNLSLLFIIRTIFKNKIEHRRCTMTNDTAGMCLLSHGIFPRPWTLVRVIGKHLAVHSIGACIISHWNICTSQTDSTSLSMSTAQTQTIYWTCCVTYSNSAFTPNWHAPN